MFEIYNHFVYKVFEKRINEGKVMSSLEVVQFPCLSDNYGVLLYDTVSREVVCIDAPEYGPIEQILISKNWSLKAIWITHHHYDHTQGIEPLKQRYNCDVIVPEKEATKIPGYTQKVDAGDIVSIGDNNFEIIAVPGHTLGHISYYCASQKLLFCGDALFVLGCGRMFEGTAQQMWSGLERLRSLPDDTNFFCGHEYSLANANFALSLDSHNAVLENYGEVIRQKTQSNESCLPALLGDEKKCNPFLRPEDVNIQRYLGVEGCNNEKVFAAIRKAKDNF